MQIDDWLEKQYYGFLTSKKNDVDLTEILRAIRSKARAKGYTEQQMNQAIKTAKEYKAYVDEQSKQHTETKPEQPQEPPQPPEPVAAEQTPEQVRKMSQRGASPEYDASNPSGTITKGNYRGESILSMADSKVSNDKKQTK